MLCAKSSQRVAGSFKARSSVCRACSTGVSCARPGGCPSVSDGVQALTGYDAQELGQQNGWSNIMRAEDKASVETAVAKAVVGRRNFDLTYRITRKTGEVRWVAERGHAIYDKDGNALFLEGVISDISGRKEADELQKTMSASWRRTLDAIPQMVWTMAGDGSDEFYNAQWARFTGCRVGGEGDPGRADLVHDDDRARVVTLWKEKFARGEPYEAQYRVKHAAGGYRWILSRGEPHLDANGSPIRWYGTCTDIHDQVLGRQALQVSEAINRSMIEASPDCICLLDANGITRFLNRAAIEALGLKSAAPLLGRPWADSFPASLWGAAVGALSCAIAGRNGRFTATHSTADGQRWWDIVVAPISDDSAQPSGLISIARDITHQKTAEKRVRLGGDEFAVLLHDVSRREEAEAVVTSIESALKPPCHF